MTRRRRASAPSAEASAPREHPSETGEVSLSFERLVFFSDAVFAIVITLLVLPLTAEITVTRGAATARHLSTTWPHVHTFVITFLVIGQFWIGHHRLYDRLRRYDQGLLWLNLFCLLAVAFMPFPAALLGAGSPAGDRFTVVFYAASMTVISASLTAMWIYAAGRGLVDPSLDRRQVSEFTLRAVLTSAIFALSIAAAFLGLLAAVTVWVALLPVARALAVRRYRASVADGSRGR
jgi:uncharacterized membrane protein